MPRGDSRATSGGPFPRGQKNRIAGARQRRIVLRSPGPGPGHKGMAPHPSRPFSVRRFQRPGFTLIELLVVVAIIAILAGLLLPVLARARDRGRAAVCQSNLRQLILAATMYDQDHNSFPIGWDNNAGRQNPPGTVVLPTTTVPGSGGQQRGGRRLYLSVQLAKGRRWTSGPCRWRLGLPGLCPERLRYQWRDGHWLQKRQRSHGNFALR